MFNKKNKKMHAKTIAIVLATTTVLQTTGLVSMLTNGEPIITAHAETTTQPTRVSISGTERVGKTLTAKLYSGNTLVTTSASVTFQWERASSKDGSYNEISGADDSTYDLTSSDKNKYVRVVATDVIDGNTYTFKDTTSKISKSSSSDDDDDDDNNDADKLDELKLLDSTDNSIKLYSEDDYDSDNKVDSDDVEEGDTYYAKTSSNKIHIDIDGADEDKVRIFKGSSDTAYKVGNDISLSKGTNSFKVRVYENDYDDYDDYDDANDSDYNEYKIQVNCTTDDTSTNTNTNTNTNGDSTNTGTNTATVKSGWVKNNTTGLWSYQDASGKALTSQWLYDNNSWYYLKSDGSMATGWLYDSGAWYFLTSSGIMKTGWVQVEGKWYFLNDNGSMASNTTVGGYYVGSDGAWIQ